MTDKPEVEVYAELERQWDKAHDDIRALYQQREQLGGEFWLKLERLERHATELGKRLDGFRNRLRPAPSRRQLRPKGVETHPMDITIDADKPEGEL